MENTTECLRGRRGFCIFEINSKILSLVAKKYSSKLDIISLIYSYLCEGTNAFITMDDKDKSKGQSTQNGQNNQNNLNSLSNLSNQNNQTSPTSPTTQPPHTFLPQHGHYRNLRVYQVTEIIYDITYYFAHRFLSKSDRTIDQMVQSARSGKQNIAEGNQAAMTSSETEIKLTNVARASLVELLDDYEDYLRVRGLEQWGPLHPRYQRMREYASSEQIRHTYADNIRRMTDEEIANLCLTSPTRPSTCSTNCSSPCSSASSPRAA